MGLKHEKGNCLSCLVSSAVFSIRYVPVRTENMGGVARPFSFGSVMVFQLASLVLIPVSHCPRNIHIFSYV